MHSKSLFSAVILLLTAAVSVQAQPPNILWSRTFSFGEGRDVGTRVLATADGNYIVTGYRGSLDNRVAIGWLIKTDQNGDTLWTKFLNWGPAWQFVKLTDIYPTPDGNYLVCGSCDMAGKILLMKVDEEGDTLWTKFYQSAVSAWSIRRTLDGNYLLVGAIGPVAQRDLWIFKFNEDGDSLWSKRLGTPGADYAYSVQQESGDSSYVIAASVAAGPEYISSAGCLLKISQEGDSLWSRRFNRGYQDKLYGVCITADNSYVLAGYCSPPGDAWLVKTDQDGDTLWTKIFGGEGEEYFRDIQLTADDAYLLAGRAQSFGQRGASAWLVKTDPEGDTLWTKTVSGEADQYFSFANVQIVAGGYIATGNIVAHEQSEALLVRFAWEGQGVGQESQLPKNFLLLPAFPNPFNSVTRLAFFLPQPQLVSLVIYDSQGRRVSKLLNSITITTGQHQLTFDASGLLSGTYLVQLQAGREAFRSQKLILVR